MYVVRFESAEGLVEAISKTGNRAKRPPMRGSHARWRGLVPCCLYKQICQTVLQQNIFIKSHKIPIDRFCSACPSHSPRGGGNNKTINAFQFWIWERVKTVSSFLTEYFPGWPNWGLVWGNSWISRYVMTCQLSVLEKSLIFHFWCACVLYHHQ